MRTSVIGLGPMGQRALLAIERLSSLELVAVCDRDPAALLSPSVGSTVKRYSDGYDLIEAERPELLIVCTTAPSHYALVGAAFAAGTPRLLCEKPLACSVAEGREMVRAAARIGARFAVNHSKRHHPSLRAVAEVVWSGVWGKLFSVSSAFPGIGLGCLATHYIDLASFISGEPAVTVSGWVDKPIAVNPRGSEFIDPGGLVVATTSSAVRWVHVQSEASAGPGHLTIDLEGARIRYDEWTGVLEYVVRDRSVLPGPGRPPSFALKDAPPPPSADAASIVATTAAVLSELAGDGPLTCDARAGLASLEVVVGAYVSDGLNHSPVVLPLQTTPDIERHLPIT